jgi:hypothetical protein
MSAAGDQERELLVERLCRLEVEVATIPELYGRLDRALAELEMERGERQATQRENERIGAVIDSMASSLSWRATKPLRNVKTLFGR